jgi:hypothetical protein
MSTPTPRTDAAWAASFSPETPGFNMRDLARTLEAELATERARLDAVVENCWLVHKGNENMFAVFSPECGDYITPWVATPRAAIDAAMKEGAK